MNDDNIFDEESEENQEGNQWIAFWCNEGLEALISVSDYKEKVLKELADKIKTGKQQNNSAEMELAALLRGMEMRARFNPQRYYELYVFSTQAGITEQDLRDWFEHTPQDAVNWIRKNGHGLVKKTAGSTTPIID